METVAPFKEAIEAIKEAGGEAYKLCYQCGMCDTACPWNRVRKFSPRGIIRQAAFGLSEIEGEDIWRCTTCGNCVQRCPRGVEIIKVQTSLRKIAAGAGITPDPIHVVVASMGAEGNPLGEAQAKRGDWTEGLSVKTFTEGTEVLYFSCCYLSYDRRLRKVAAATASILNKAGVDFGILGAKESCCGESARKTGDEALFKRLARENIKAFIDSGVKKIVVSSPHCYHSFKNEYPEFMANFQVMHITQYLLQLMKEGRLKLTKDFAKKVTYHDPCYLGRHNGVFDEPREVLENVPGLQMFEMPDARKDSLCCGGGGGGIWMDRKKGERFSDIRVKQALDGKADVLVTACPYCIMNFEASTLTLDSGEALEIKDITEVIQEAI